MAAERDEVLVKIAELKSAIVDYVTEHQITLAQLEHAYDEIQRLESKIREYEKKLKEMEHAA